MVVVVKSTDLIVRTSVISAGCRPSGCMRAKSTSCMEAARWQTAPLRGQPIAIGMPWTIPTPGHATHDHQRRLASLRGGLVDLEMEEKYSVDFATGRRDRDNNQGLDSINPTSSAEGTERTTGNLRVATTELMLRGSRPPRQERERESTRWEREDKEVVTLDLFESQMHGETRGPTAKILELGARVMFAATRAGAAFITGSQRSLQT